MAKKKRKRPNAPASRGAAGTKVAAPGPAPRVAPAEPGGPNRAVRKEEARRQREVIQRRMKRRRSLRIVGAIVAVLLVSGAITAYALTRPPATLVAGCGPVLTTHAYHPASEGGPGDQAHVIPATRPKISAYPTHPPTSGPHDATPLPAGDYSAPPDIYRAIHSLEHATVIVWYRPGLASGDIQKIKDFYTSPPTNDHVIVAPYSYPSDGAAGRLPAGKDMVLVAWHRYQACDEPSLAVVRDFVKQYRAVVSPPPSSYKGVAPEAGGSIG
ncbi:MAG: DUF3105 domain-containing protein [Actinomycetota bacterium]